MSEHSRLYAHAMKMWDYMAERAEVEEADGAEVLMFRGKITDAFKWTGSSQQNYSKIIARFDVTGSWSIIERGAYGRLSVVALLRRPTGEEFDAATLTRASEGARVLSQRVTNLEAQFKGGIHLPTLARDFEERLRKLEKDARNNGT